MPIGDGTEALRSPRRADIHDAVAVDAHVCASRELDANQTAGESGVGTGIAQLVADEI